MPPPKGSNKSSQPNPGKSSNQQHPNLANVSSALLNSLFPHASSSSSASASASASSRDPSTTITLPLPLDENSDEHRKWQTYADHLFAQNLALQEEEEAKKLANSSKNGFPTNNDCDEDEKLARKLAQEEEDAFFGTSARQDFVRPQTSGYNKVPKSKAEAFKARHTKKKEYNPINYSNVTIHTKSSKKMAKLLAKEHFNSLTTNNDTDTSDSLSVARRLQAAREEIRYPNVYDALLDAKMTLSSVNNQKVYLPNTSSRQSYNDYEKITVEKMDKLDLIPQDKLIAIDEKNFTEVDRIAFAGCKQLNPMQSVVFETAYKTNKNMLVAAPTGAGKTNVAMLTVLSELKHHFQPGSTKLKTSPKGSDFKIIYIAPMKSLATEQTDNFATRLRKVGIVTRELTGDMSLTEHELSQTHIIVTTPEKWDVVTRKSKGTMDLMSLVRLLIIDEVHLLQSDRGPVLEALVARTLRYVESSQKMIRIVGLSATLPNYVDVATFLRVNPYEGLFYFDNRFRPVPLTQTFIGVRPLDSNSRAKIMDKVCYNECLHHVTQSKQVMIFVHARNSTQKVAGRLREFIQLANKMELFQPDLAEHPEAAKLMASSRNNLLKDFFNIGFGIHHAGMIRHDRLLVEKLFRMGVLKVLVCTATLAWGVNFPAHAVIIRGTEIYDASVGKFVDIGLLDVMQIFGRAGRPQYDTYGHAIIITALDKMDSYLKLLTNQTPIESNFIKFLTDNLNAEIVSGTVSTIGEGMEWLRYTYLNVRLAQNPLAYGCEHYEIESDPSLATIRNRLIVAAARQLDEALMCRYNQDNGQLEATDLGRIASHFYINYETITRYNEIFNDHMSVGELLELIGEAREFQQIKFREEEQKDLTELRQQCKFPVNGSDIETTKGKVKCLLQAYIGRLYVEAHSLVSDLMYISQNATRIARGLFEYSLKRGWHYTSLNLIKCCKMLELQMWEFNSTFRHFDLPFQVINSIERSRLSVERIDTMTNAEVAKAVNFPEAMGSTIKKYLGQIPYVIVEGKVKPLKSNIVSMNLTIEPFFDWNDSVHGRKHQSFWMWIIDDSEEQIYYSELIKFTKEQVQKKQARKLNINIPLLEDMLSEKPKGRDLPNDYIVYVISNDWNGCDYEFVIDCSHTVIPSEKIPFTKVPDNLNQLPVNVFRNELFVQTFQMQDLQISSTGTSTHDEELSITTGSGNQLNHEKPLMIQYFNSLQSQVFYPLYYCDRNLFIAGPPGSGKTMLADIAILRNFNKKAQGKHKIFYVTPLDSLAQLKYREWSFRFGNVLGKKITYLSNCVFNEQIFNQTDLFVTSADNFNIWLCDTNSLPSLSSRASLFIFDDLHLLCDKRGSTLELVVSKLNYLKSQDTRIRFRYIGISNSISNPQDVASWLGIKKNGAYNFHPAISRPIQLEIHIQSFPERHYLPRMTSMNKPIYSTITQHCSKDPALVFVSSKKQCSSTALELVSCLCRDGQYNDKRWLNIEQLPLQSLLRGIQDEDLKLSLEFGIGFIFPSMRYSDKKTCHELFSYDKIRVLICTTNYAWESNLRARLVIVKGTEHYSEETDGFTDYLPTDVMQMLGKAGRHGTDSTGIAVLMIKDAYKEFYKKFLYETFPLESNLLNCDEELIKNFFVSDFQPTISNPSTSLDQPDSKNPPMPKEKAKATIPRRNLVPIKKHAMSKFPSTFLVRRLTKNPSFYENNEKSLIGFLTKYLDTSKFLYDSI